MHGEQKVTHYLITVDKDDMLSATRRERSLPVAPFRVIPYIVPGNLTSFLLCTRDRQAGLPFVVVASTHRALSHDVVRTAVEQSARPRYLEQANTPTILTSEMIVDMFSTQARMISDTRFDIRPAVPFFAWSLAFTHHPPT